MDESLVATTPSPVKAKVVTEFVPVTIRGVPDAASEVQLVSWACLDRYSVCVCVLQGRLLTLSSTTI